MKIDDVASALLDHVVESGGVVEDRTESGQLIKGMAEATGVTYGQCAVAVRYLEDIGFLRVERYSHNVSSQHNFVVRVELAQ